MTNTISKSEHHVTYTEETITGFSVQNKTDLLRGIMFFPGDKVWCTIARRLDEDNSDKLVYQWLHRIDGPAIERASGEKEFWIDGTKYPELEYWIAVEKYKKESVNG